MMPEVNLPLGYQNKSQDRNLKASVLPLVRERWPSRENSVFEQGVQHRAGLESWDCCALDLLVTPTT